MNFADLINRINGLVWAMPAIAFLAILSLAYMIAMKFGTLRNVKLQWKLLISEAKDSDEGLSPYETFSTVVAYRVAVGNVGGVAVALLYGGPGALFWMLITSLVTSAISYAENSLGQIYKYRKDGQYRGGPYDYIEAGLGIKPLSVIFAFLAFIAVPFFIIGPGANNIGMAFENSLGISPTISGAIVSILLFLVIAGGVKRIATFSTMIVPIMCGLYIGLAIVITILNIRILPETLGLILSSAFGQNAIYGGLMGGAVSWGIKRAVNSSGAGMGETPPTAAAAEAAHPAEQGLVNAFTVFVDVAVCLSSGLMMVITDCYNTLAVDGASFLHIGEGSAILADQAAKGIAGVVWVQEAANSTVGNIGGIIVAFSLVFFAFSTTLAYYYEGESGIAYLAKNSDAGTRRKLIWVLRILMPIMFFLWFHVEASLAWAISEIALGLMLWVNGIALLLLFKPTIKVYNDYMDQVKAGVEEPYFNPEKLGIKNADVWMDINKEHIERDRAKNNY